MVRAAGFEPASSRVRAVHNEPLYDARMEPEVGHDPTGTDHLSATALIGRRPSPEDSGLVAAVRFELTTLRL